MLLFNFINYTKAVVKHENKYKTDKMIDSQGFFNKTVVRFSFINIFAFC